MFGYAYPRKMIPKSKYKGSWVWLNTCFSEYAFKCKILKIVKEADSWCYLVEYENKERESIFVNSVTRIFPHQQKTARVIDIRSKVRLIKKGS